MPASNPLGNGASEMQIAPATPESIARAADLLRMGGIVAVPTETVYGLAANAGDERAVARIYAAKGRPDFNPLIVHVPDMARAEPLVKMGDIARALAETFWPGPLTMVLPRQDHAPIAAAVTAGLTTLAVRCPDHSVMQALLRQSGLPLAAPSANKSGGISPTEAAHVASSLGGAVPLILDGGPCTRGIESTILALIHDCNGKETGWRILRPGPIDPAEIARIAGVIETPNATLTIEAPGQMSSHYAPSKPVRLNATEAVAGEFFIGFAGMSGDVTLSDNGDLAEAASRLYACLHLADASMNRAIAIAPISGGAMADAINDRLKRAAAS
jgi:L-threonylcarbamoyladenylate synthase